MSDAEHVEAPTSQTTDEPGAAGIGDKPSGAHRGIGLLVIGLFIIHALGTWLAKHHPQPELATEGPSA